MMKTLIFSQLIFTFILTIFPFAKKIYRPICVCGPSSTNQIETDDLFSINYTTTNELLSTNADKKNSNLSGLNSMLYVNRPSVTSQNLYDLNRNWIQYKKEGFKNELKGKLSEYNFHNLKTLSIEHNNLDILSNLSTINYWDRGNFEELLTYHNQFIFKDLLYYNLWLDFPYFIYAPQGSVYRDTTIQFMEEESVFLDLNIDLGINNHYRWFKDGQFGSKTIGDAHFEIHNLTLKGKGNYDSEISNDPLKDLTSNSKTIRIVVKEITCRKRDSLELVEFFNATGGSDWTITWDLEQPLESWYGLLLNNDGCLNEINLSDNYLTGCFPISLKIYCTNPFLTGKNPLLPLQGVNLDSLCDGDIQIGTPCDDGNPNTINDFIRDDCNCKGIYDNHITPILEPITGESFNMGCPVEQESCNFDESPVHSVTISNFSIGKYEVTQEEWESLMGGNPSFFRDCGNNCPVDSVSWYEAIVFCNRLSEKENLRPCYYSDKEYTIVFGKSGQSWNLPNVGEVYWQKDAEGYRLPTEAEWEFAARGGIKSKGFLYSGGNEISEVAWWRDNSSNQTHPVGSKDPNELGLYDMSGNVDEWCWDWYIGDYNCARTCQPTGPNNGSTRVIRGGLWFSREHGCRISDRGWDQPDVHSNRFGFRLAKGPLLPDVCVNFCRSSDSTDLVDFYHSTNGLNWNIPWDLNIRIDNWKGVMMNETSCVVKLDLSNSNLIGTIPNSIKLENIEELYLDSNSLTGEVPYEIFSCTNLKQFRIGGNEFTFSDIIGSIDTINSIIDQNTKENEGQYIYAPQDSFFVDTSITFSTNTIDTISLGIDSEIITNRYVWFKDEMPIDTVIGENFRIFNFVQPEDRGNYWVIVTNPLAPNLILYSRNIRLEVEALPCPDLAAPIGSGDQNYCLSEEPPSLSVNVSEGETALWYKDELGIDLIYKGTSYLPGGPNTYYVFSALENDIQCRSKTFTTIKLEQNLSPTIQLWQKNCSPDLTTYRVIFRIENADEISTSFGTLVQGQDQHAYSISDVPINQAILITANNTISNCQTTFMVSPGCCVAPPPPQLASPIQTVCLGSNEPATFTAQFPNSNEFTIDWYDQPRGGNIVAGGQGTLSLETNQLGVFYAETRRKDDRSCISKTRTRALLGYDSSRNPIVEEYKKFCNPDGNSYAIELTIKNEDLVSGTPFTPVPLSNGRYLIDNIPLNDETEIIALNTVSGCETKFRTSPPPCECINIPLPTPVGDSTFQYCQGNQNFPEFKVEVPEGMTVNWYDAPDGGNLIASNTIQFKPNRPGVFYAQTILPGMECPNNGRQGFIVEEIPLTIIYSPLKTCDLSLVGSEQFKEIPNMDGDHCDTVFLITYDLIEGLPPNANAGPDIVLCNGETSAQIESHDSIPPHIEGKWYQQTDDDLILIDSFSIIYIEELDPKQSPFTFIWTLSTKGNTDCQDYVRDTMQVFLFNSIQLNNDIYEIPSNGTLMEEFFMENDEYFPPDFIFEHINSGPQKFGSIRFDSTGTGKNKQLFFNYNAIDLPGTEQIYYRVCDPNCPHSPCDTALIQINIDCQFKKDVPIPDGFIPSRGDEFNPFFYLKRENCEKKLQNARLTIYNRWSRPIFKINSDQRGWDGKNGSLFYPTDTYYYELKFDFYDGLKIISDHIRGPITLLNP